ncbi:hypothetical protein VB711_11025 [Cronbergia sp. UHCC 0137]|uniref:hypothetical protein n=1 Tax=Cronbergia sp. UHCC 0137 TaxID=3110239 RepID=UPI002B208934|nr:hypothetical protein [Cronbergia sp. UHCC 0137]MEA5618365.1 hypothetical protein [Cronbergia sp. UHCC 0137]
MNQETHKNDSEKQPWWNRPLWSDKSLWEALVASIFKPKVPDGMIFLHNRELESAEIIANQAEKIDDKKFTSKEFITLLTIRRNISKGTNYYQEISVSAQRLKAAIEVKDCFETIWQVEFQYLSRKQTEYYQFVESHLDKNRTEFVHLCNAKLNEILSEITSDKGRQALNAYQDAIEKLSATELGLELFSLFKSLNLGDFLVLRTISFIVDTIQADDLTDPTVIIPSIIDAYKILENLIPIIKYPPEKFTPENFAIIVQLVALEFKHGLSYSQFKQLVALLEQWHHPCQQVFKIRNEYSAKKYKQPKEFSRKVLGLKLYNKYAEWLNK